MTVHPPAARTVAESAFAEQFSTGQGALPLPEREAAFRAFSAKGLPTRRDEAGSPVPSGDPPITIRAPGSGLW